MKIVKISLVIIVILAITSLVYIEREAIKSFFDPPSPPIAENQFGTRIENMIDSIPSFSNKESCYKFHEEISYIINDNYKKGKLSVDTLENEQLKDELSKNLYSAYVEKFIQQAFDVFKQSNWRNTDLKFIRNKYKELRTSEFLENDSPTEKKFNEIKIIFRKYDEIAIFIWTCKSYEFNPDNIATLFPVSEVKEKISKSKKYLNNYLDNHYVNNCVRLKDGLKNVPTVLFKVHYNYIDKIIKYKIGQYDDYDTQSEYVQNVNEPLKSRLKLLDNTIYELPDNKFNDAYHILFEKLSENSINAYNYYINKNTNNY